MEGQLVVELTFDAPRREQRAGTQSQVAQVHWCRETTLAAVDVDCQQQDRDRSGTNRGSPHRPWSYGRSGARPKFKTVLSVTSNRDSLVLKPCLAAVTTTSPSDARIK